MHSRMQSANKSNIFYFHHLSMTDNQSNHSSIMHKQRSMISDPLKYEERNVTDCCCIIIGLLFTVTLLTLSFVFSNADHLTKTSLPSDTSGKVCGVDYPKHSFIYFVNLPQIRDRLCVSHCPQPGDAKLDCAPSGNLGCKFNNMPGYAIKYYDTEGVQDTNGNICMPTDEDLRAKVNEDADLENRSLFFKSFKVLLLCLAFSIGLSLLFFFLVNNCPAITLKVTIYLSIVVILALSLILFLYKTENKTSKLIIAIVLVILLVLNVVNVIGFQKGFNVSGIFLKESTKFASSSRSTLLYIPIFMLMQAGFFLILLQEYKGFVSMGVPSFDASQSLYYEVNSKSFIFTITLLVIHLIWGLSFIKEAFNFCIASHAIRHYLSQDWGICDIIPTFELLIFKHLGSVIASSFINSFLMVPDMMVDVLRVCWDVSFKVLDLVRSEALAFVSLMGTPYCNSAMYCDYLSNSTMISDYTQTVMRTYRIAAHVTIAGIVSIVGLYINGSIEPYTVAATFILGVFVSTFFISYNTDSAEALMMMFFLEEEFKKRKDASSKINYDSSRKTDRDSFLKMLDEMYSNDKELAAELKEERKQQWDEVWTE